jgi:MSHA biogenesis protein MshG
MARAYQTDDLVLFTQHVSSAVRLGVPLHQTVELLSGEMTNRGFRRALADVSSSLSAGETLYEALSRHAKQFPDYYLRILKAGEQAGTLADTLDQLADLLQKNFLMSQKLKRIFAYPLAILALLTVAWILYTNWLFPAFMEVYVELGAELPAGFQLLIQFQEWSVPTVLFLILIFFLIARKFARVGWCGLVFDRFDLHFPVLGVFTRYAIASRLARALGVMLRNGVTLPDAMGLCGEMLENKKARESIYKAKESVEKGETLGAALISETLFPPTMVWMLSAAEARGDFVGALDHLADFYAAKVENSSQWFLEILEPLAIIVVGSLMVILAFGLFSPIFNLASMF